MPAIRPPAVAGMFYPADPHQLKDYVVSALARAAREVPRLGPVKAVIAPHAGYVYSGDIAAHAFAALGRDANVRRIVLMGPAHTVPLRGIAHPAGTPSPRRSAPCRWTWRRERPSPACRR